MPGSDKTYQIAIAVVVIILHVFVLFAHENLVLNWFTTDDAFYYFKIAENIVEGKGISFDGIATTNGFHPLWMIFILPIFTFARFDLILPLRILIGLQTILGVFAGISVYRLCRRLISQPVSFLVAIIWVLYPAFHDITNKGGTEGGLNALIIPLVWVFYLKITESGSLLKMSKWHILGLGTLASLVLLTRLDNVFLVFIMGIGLLIHFWQGSASNYFGIISTWKQWIKLGAYYYLPLFTSLGLYMLGNKLYFGAEMPVSGKIKRWWSTLNHTVYGSPPDNFEDIFDEIISTNSNIGPWSIIFRSLSSLKNILGSAISIRADANSYQIMSVVILFAILLILAIWIYQSRKLFVKTIKTWNLGILFLACIVHISYYKITGQSAQKSWYWITENFLVLLLIAITLESLYRFIGSIKFGRWVGNLAVLISVIGLIVPYVNLSKYIINYSPPLEEHFYLMRAGWLEDNTEPGSLIGMTGSGSTGYFVRDRVIVNLDGLANSMAYFVHLQKSTADDYLASIGVDYIFGNPEIIIRSNPYAWNFPDRLVEWKYFIWGDKTLVLFQFK